MQFALSLVSVALGVAGLAYAMWERHARIRLGQVLDNYVFRTMEQIQSLMVYREDMRRILEGVDKPEIREWAMEMHKGCSDLYRTSVDHFLSTRARFTFDDLDHLVKSGVITTRWEEGVWRSSVGPRAENVGEEPPSFFVDDSEGRRHHYFAQEGAEPSAAGDAR